MVNPNPYPITPNAYAISWNLTETPFFMVYGRDMNGPADATLREWKEERKGVKWYTQEVVERMEKARKRMKEELKKQKAKMKEKFDKGREESDYKVGELVWLRNKKVELGQHHKMAKKWVGPYRIISVCEDNPNVVEIRSVWNRQEEQNVNVAILKRVFVRESANIPQDIEASESEEEEKQKEVG